MRILHVVGRSHRRGAEQVALELAEELEARGHSNRLVAVTLGHEGNEVPELVALVRTAVQRPADLVRGAVALRSIVRDPAGDGRPDVIVAHAAAAALVAVGAAPRRPPAIVFQTIMAMAPQSFVGVQGAAWRLAVRRIDGVVALTGPIGEEIERLGYRGPMWSIPNARRAERFADLDRAVEGERLRARLGIGTGTALIGIVGYLVAQKRPERAVEVLARLGLPDVHLVVAGEGPLDGQVRAAARDLGVADRVTLLGHCDDVPQVLAGLDLLVLTSDDEGVPGIVIEAAMAGCPVVAFPLGGVGEVVDDGVTGRVLDGPSVPAMAAAVAALLEDPQRLAEMSVAARRRGEDYSMERVADRYLDCFLELEL